MQGKAPKTLISIVHVTVLKAIGTMMGVAIAIGVANLFGASGATDAYFLARRIIMNVGMALERAFQLLEVPPLIGLLHQKGMPAVRRVLNRRRRIVFVVSLVASALAYAWAGPLLAMIAPGFDAAQTEDAARYFRIMLLTIPIAAVTALTGAALSALKVFSLPVAARLIPRVAILVALFVVPLGFGLDVLSWAVVAGTLVMGIIFAITVRRAFSSDHVMATNNGEAALHNFSRSRMIAMLLAQLHIVGASWIDMGFASVTGVGGVATLEFGQRLVNSAPGLVTNSVVLVYYTEFAVALAAGDNGRFHSLMRESLRTTLFTVLPIAAGLMLFSGQVVQILLEHGSFDEAASHRTQQIVTILGALLPVNAALGTLTAGVFADSGMSHIRIILISSVLALAARVAVDVTLINTLGVIAVPIGALVGMIVLLIAIYMALTVRIGPLIRTSEIKPFLALTLATVGSAVAMWGMRVLLISGTETRVQLAMDVLAGSVVGGVAFLGLAAILHLPEVGIVRRRLTRLISKWRRP